LWWPRATAFERRYLALRLGGPKPAHLLLEFRLCHVFIESASNDGIRETEFKFPFWAG